MREIRPFVERAYSEGSQYDTDFIGRGVASVSIRSDGTVTAGTNPFDDASARLLGTPEVVQAEQVLIRMEGPDWYHLAAIASGGYSKITNGVGGNAYEIELNIPFEDLMPGAAINAASNRVFLRGTFAALADYAATPPTAIVGTLRPFVRSSSLDLSRGFRRPKISQFSVALESADSDIQRKIDFEQDTLVQGIMVRAFDSSGTGRTDGLIRRMRVDVTLGGGGSRELIRTTWGQLRQLLGDERGFSVDDITSSRGIVFVPLIDPRNVVGGGGFFFRKGDSVTLHFDTASTSEAGWSATTPAAGDKAICTLVAYSLVAGRGDGGADDEQRSVAARALAPRAATDPFAGRR